MYVYRFLSSGSIEEKVFQRQLSKGVCEGEGGGGTGGSQGGGASSPKEGEGIFF